MKKKVIIIEDNLIPSLSLEAMLSERGFDVVDKMVSANGAIEKIKLHQPDLLILDIRLKDNTSGLDIANELRSFDDTPILFVSALTDKDSIEQMKKISRSLIVSKPYTEIDFERAINEFYPQ